VPRWRGRRPRQVPGEGESHHGQQGPGAERQPVPAGGGDGQRPDDGAGAEGRAEQVEHGRGALAEGVGEQHVDLDHHHPEADPEPERRRQDDRPGRGDGDPGAPATSRAVAARSQVRGARRRSSPHQAIPVMAPAKWALRTSADPPPPTP
jgi:hypothetical protein